MKKIPEEKAKEKTEDTETKPKPEDLFDKQKNIVDHKRRERK